jgi:hypothetical protein
MHAKSAAASRERRLARNRIERPVGKTDALSIAKDIGLKDRDIGEGPSAGTAGDEQSPEARRQM